MSGRAAHVTGPDTTGVGAYDTAQYVDAQGGPCSDASLITDQDIVILTVPSQAKETDWLHQNDRGGAFMHRGLRRRLRFLPTGPCSRAR